MKSFLACLLGVIALMPLCAAEPSLLIGKWKLPESEAVRISCSSASTEYTADGKSISRSGQNISSASYELTPHKSGFLLKQLETANNGEPNCQGLESKFVREHTPTVAYIEVSSTELRIFQLENTAEPLFKFIRVHPLASRQSTYALAAQPIHREDQSR